MSQLSLYIPIISESISEAYIKKMFLMNNIGRIKCVDFVKNKDYEVLYLSDPMDEYVVQQLKEFDDKKSEFFDSFKMQREYWTKKGIKYNDNSFFGYATE